MHLSRLISHEGEVDEDFFKKIWGAMTTPSGPLPTSFYPWVGVKKWASFWLDLLREKYLELYIIMIYDTKLAHDREPCDIKKKKRE